MSSFYTAALIDLMLLMATAFGAAAGYAVAIWRHKQERKRHRSLRHYVRHVERELDDLRRQQPTEHPTTNVVRLPIGK